MTDWLSAHHTIIWWLASTSVVTFVLTLILIPIIVVRLPHDYFAHRSRHAVPWADHHPVVRTVLLIGQNTLGVVFVAAGFAMLLLPGQGILTMIIGILLLTFPGKYRLERWAISRGPVLRTCNRMRRRAGRPAFVLDQPHAAASQI